MKSLKFLFTFLSVAFLSSCLDTEEKIEMNADDSGNYSLKIDLGRMISMAASMGGEKADPEKVKEKKDTTVYLKDMVNKADNLTAEEKALYQNGVVHIKLDEAAGEMKIEMTTPFKRSADLMEIKKNFATVVNKLKAFEKAAGEAPKEGVESEDAKMESKSTNPVGDQFTFFAAPGVLSSTITNMDAFKEKIAADSTLTMITQMTSMMGDFNYKTIVVLPKAVKKYDGPGTVISADKKTITFVTSLSEMMEHPEKASYKVEY
jgi:hypothetical protein